MAVTQPTGIPDLCLDSLAVGLDALRGKLHTDGGLLIQRELVAREASEQVALANTAVTDQHNCGERKDAPRTKHTRRQRTDNGDGHGPG